MKRKVLLVWCAISIAFCTENVWASFTSPEQSVSEAAINELFAENDQDDYDEQDEYFEKQQIRSWRDSLKLIESFQWSDDFCDCEENSKQ